MSDKINPKYIHGEPKCSGGCPQNYFHNDCFWCKIEDPTVCIPAIRRDRDKYKAELASALERERELQREFCNEVAPFMDLYPHEYAEQRRWVNLFDDDEKDGE